MFLTKLQVIKANFDITILNKFSASPCIKSEIEYLFFLNHKGRYIADLFVMENFLIAPSVILTNFQQHISQFDLQKNITFETSNLNVYFDSQEGMQDPRNICKILLTEKTLETTGFSCADYLNKKIALEIAEFENFEFEKSIILEYGTIASFISLTKGCYLGQELMQRTATTGAIRKTVKAIAKNALKQFTISKILEENDKFFLALIRY